MHGRDIDWAKVHEVTLALLWLGRRGGGREVPCRTPQPLLDALYEDGLIDDPRAILGTVELTAKGLEVAEEMARRHFGRGDGSDAMRADG